MARTLVSLPLELQMSIVEAVHYKDLLNLSLSCKHLYRLAKPFLQEHKRFSSIGSQGSFSFDTANMTKNLCMLHPPMTLELLSYISHHPRFRHHIEKLDGFGEESDLRLAGESTAIDFDQMSKLFRGCCFIETENHEAWMHNILARQGGALLALLLSQLPDLKYINLPSQTGDPIGPYVTGMIFKCAIKCDSGYIDQPLSSLKTVSVFCQGGYNVEVDGFSRLLYDAENTTKTLMMLGKGHAKSLLVFFWSLTFLPSFEELAITNYESELSGYEDEESRSSDEELFDEAMDVLTLGHNTLPRNYFLHKRSSLKSLELTTTRMSPPCLSFILRNSKDLEVFRYTVSEDANSAYNHVQEEIAPIISVLERRSRGSLKTLHLAQDPENYYDPTDILFPLYRDWDLKAFTSLIHLTIAFELLPAAKVETVRALIDILPPTIQSVDLLCFFFDPQYHQDMIFQSLSSFDPRNFPHLRLLSVWYTHYELRLHRTRSHTVQVEQHILSHFRKCLLEAGFGKDQVRDTGLLNDDFLPCNRIKFPDGKRTEDMQYTSMGGRDRCGIAGAEMEGHFVMGTLLDAFNHESDAYEYCFHGVAVEKDW
ncbi:hypothetical protein AJ79_02286 [Helicocarpus griseus UAMH5409]|uniref:F-box domain-containing protein n=1 Tax=Helicocarpus griseus UAMH5409 TaxID=1447875 RepID=A0A2B7Y4C0_9EURO|nr:hypothetical protein AJ79_02286 [Helicocarpus griseus UAMH5409]